MAQTAKLSLIDTSWMKEQALLRRYFARKHAAQQDDSTERDLQAQDAALVQLKMWQAVCEVPSRLDRSQKKK